MRKDKILWITLIVVSVALLIGYTFWEFNLYKNYYPNNNRYYGGMMDRWNNTNSYQLDSEEKLSLDQIESIVNDYIKGYGANLEVSDIFVYKDTDYYVSVEEKDSGKGAMELLVNPYTGRVYPEYGPNMMWNEKYDMMHGGYGMQGGYGMMGPGRWNNYNDNRVYSKQISKEQAVGIADEYVKDILGEELSVTGEGHEFYGYYTFHINQDNNTLGMMSVNYYTGEVWYHDWHGELEQVISDHKE